MIEKDLDAMNPTTRLKTLRELYRAKDPLFDTYMERAAGMMIEHYGDTQRHLENIYQDNCENAYVEVSELDRVRQALAEADPTNPALCAVPPSFGVWEQQRARITALESDLATAIKDRDAAIEAGKVLAKEVFAAARTNDCHIGSNLFDWLEPETDENPLALAWLKAAQEASNG